MALSKPINKILLIHDEFTQSERLIADYILNNKEMVSKMTVRELAKGSYCSPALVMKFINKLGYDSFVIFKLELMSEGIKVDEQILKTFSLVDEYFKENEQSIKKLVERIKKSDRIYIYAAGQSKVPALDFSGRLIRRNYDVVFNVDSKKEIDSLGDIQSKDLVLYISNSGNSRELQTFTKIINNDIHLITNNKASKLACAVEKVFCLDNNLDGEYTARDYPISSKYSLMYFLDLLFLSL